MNEQIPTSDEFEIDLPKTTPERYESQTARFSHELKHKLAQVIVNRGHQIDSIPISNELTPDSLSEIQRIRDPEIAKLVNTDLQLAIAQWAEVYQGLGSRNMAKRLAPFMEQLRTPGIFLESHANELERLYDTVGPAAAHQYALILEPSSLYDRLLAQSATLPDDGFGIEELLAVVHGPMGVSLSPKVKAALESSESSYRKMYDDNRAYADSGWRAFLIDKEPTRLEGELANAATGFKEYSFLEWISMAIQSPNLFAHGSRELLPGSIVRRPFERGLFSAYLDDKSSRWNIELISSGTYGNVRRIARV